MVTGVQTVLFRSLGLQAPIRAPRASQSIPGAPTPPMNVILVPKVLIFDGFVSIWGSRLPSEPPGPLNPPPVLQIHPPWEVAPKWISILMPKVIEFDWFVCIWGSRPPSKPPGPPNPPPEIKIPPSPWTYIQASKNPMTVLGSAAEAKPIN